MRCLSLAYGRWDPGWLGPRQCCRLLFRVEAGQHIQGQSLCQGQDFNSKPYMVGSVCGCPAQAGRKGGFLGPKPGPERTAQQKGVLCSDTASDTVNQ